MEVNHHRGPVIPLEPAGGSLERPTPSMAVDQVAHPPDREMPEDSAATHAEKVQRRDADVVEESPAKRRKLECSVEEEEDQVPTKSERQKGVVPIKAEYLVHLPGSKGDRSATVADDDAAEGAAHVDQSKGGERGKKERSRGQNSNRTFGMSRDEVGLCSSRANSAEFSHDECKFGDSCKFEHNLRKYLKDWKREDLTTFDGICPIWKANGRCYVGWKCRFVKSHMQERDTEDGRQELVLVENSEGSRKKIILGASENGSINEVSGQAKNDLMKRRLKTPKADSYSEWIEKSSKEFEEQTRLDAKIRRGEVADTEAKNTNGNVETDNIQDNRARYTEPPFQPSEKRKIYFGAETPVLAPLTTQGNLPFRRLCVDLGAQVTYSEMAMSLPLTQGHKSEWALMRAHESEATPPLYRPTGSIVTDYDNAKDLKFGAQIAANKPWQALKTTEILTQLCPHLRVIDLNCGCPIDLIFRQGAGSALLDSPGKLEKILRGMNTVSGEVPITVKIRMGTKDNKPTSLKLVDRLAYGGLEALELGGGPSGVAAITLHGRSRQQRYTKNANWEYIAECAALIKEYNERGDTLSDTIREVEERSQSSTGRVYFLGNGDCYSHVDYNAHMEQGKVDSVMIARGALIKPWIFEEIQQGQYIDKSATERLALVEQYVRYGLETWGSDEIGVGTTRRFLLEWLSFAYRYVPVGIMEHLPPSLQDRPPAWRGRNELETLLGSDNYKDWIKIR